MNFDLFSSIGENSPVFSAKGMTRCAAAPALLFGFAIRRCLRITGLAHTHKRRRAGCPQSAMHPQVDRPRRQEHQHGQNKEHLPHPGGEGLVIPGRGQVQYCLRHLRIARPTPYAGGRPEVFA